MIRGLKLWKTVARRPGRAGRRIMSPNSDSARELTSTDSLSLPGPTRATGTVADSEFKFPTSRPVPATIESESY